MKEELEVQMYPYWSSNKGQLFYTPNVVYAMCRQRGSDIVIAKIPVTWKKYF